MFCFYNNSNFTLVLHSARDLQHRSDFTTFGHNAKIMSLVDDEPAPMPVVDADSKQLCLPGDDGAARKRRRVVQRDGASALLQSYELVRFACGAPRSDALSFDWEKKERQVYREYLVKHHGNHNLAFEEHVKDWHEQCGQTKGRSKSIKSLVGALFGLVRLRACEEEEEREVATT